MTVPTPDRPGLPPRLHGLLEIGGRVWQACEAGKIAHAVEEARSLTDLNQDLRIEAVRRSPPDTRDGQSLREAILARWSDLDATVGDELTAQSLSELKHWSAVAMLCRYTYNPRDLLAGAALSSRPVPAAPHLSTEPVASLSSDARALLAFNGRLARAQATSHADLARRTLLPAPRFENAVEELSSAGLISPRAERIVEKARKGDLVRVLECHGFDATGLVAALRARTLATLDSLAIEEWFDEFVANDPSGGKRRVGLPDGTQRLSQLWDWVDSPHHQLPPRLWDEELSRSFSDHSMVDSTDLEALHYSIDPKYNVFDTSEDLPDGVLWSGDLSTEGSIVASDANYLWVATQTDRFAVDRSTGTPVPFDPGHIHGPSISGIGTVRFDITPVIDGDVTYCFTDTNHLYAIETATGRTIWRRSNPAYARSAVFRSPDGFLVHLLSDQLVARSPIDGKIAWRRRTSNAGPLVCLRDVAVVPQEGNTIATVISLIDGQIIARPKTRRPARPLRYYQASRLDVYAVVIAAERGLHVLRPPWIEAELIPGPRPWQPSPLKVQGAVVTYVAESRSGFQLLARRIDGTQRIP